MMGFLRRDVSLLLPNLKFYGLLIAVFTVLGLTSSRSGNYFASLYIVLFSSISLVNLFSYDELNHWLAYAAAVPGGRRALVDARYLLTAGMGLAAFVLQLFLNLLSRASFLLYDVLYDQTHFLRNALLYGALVLLYAAVILPLSYRSGGNKARAVFAGLAALLGAGMAIAGTLLSLPQTEQTFSFLSAAIPCFAAGLFVLSWLLSRRIMDKKEL